MDRVFIFLYKADLKIFKQLKPKKEEIIICADSGIKLARKLWYKPKKLILIGDLDSVENSDVEWCNKNNFEIIKYPENKDKTDGELVIEYDCKNFDTDTRKIVVGGITDRIDHTLGNISAIIPYIKEDHKFEFHIEKENIFITSKSILLRSKKNNKISLMPIERVLEVKTRGLKWELENENIELYSTRTLRNEAIKEKLTIEFKKGVLMIIETW